VRENGHLFVKNVIQKSRSTNFFPFLSQTRRQVSAYGPTQFYDTKTFIYAVSLGESIHERHDSFKFKKTWLNALKVIAEVHAGPLHQGSWKASYASGLYYDVK